MLGLGWSEMLVIAAVALVVVGPDRLPMVMRQLGRWYGQFRRAADDLRRAFVLEADRQDASDRYKQLQERRKRAQELRKQSEVEAGGSVAQVDPLAPALVPTTDPSEGAAAVTSAAEAPEVSTTPERPAPEVSAPEAPAPEPFAGSEFVAAAAEEGA